MLKRQLKLQKSLDTLSSFIYEYFNTPSDLDCSSNQLFNEATNATKNQLFDPVDSHEELADLEEKLKNTDYLSQVVNSMSFICGRSGDGIGLDCCYKLIDYFITRNFANQCSWTGNTRTPSGSGKVPLKFYENFRKCFRNVVILADSKFTETDCDDFFKRILKHSVQRINANQLRQSKHKNRKKNLKYWKGRIEGKESLNEAEKHSNESQSNIKIDTDYSQEEMDYKE